MALNQKIRKVLDEFYHTILRMQVALDTVKNHFAQYTVAQGYEQYTEADHESWRRTMASLVDALRTRCAVPHVAALQASGLDPNFLPRLATINRALTKFDWRAVIVDSFIPPPAFMALQASGTLPITRHVRQPSQLAYTPIPDIVHEAAGHLPMLVDAQYRQFLRRFGAFAKDLRFSRLDEQVYEAQKRFAEHAAEPQPDERKIGELCALASELRREQAQALTPACLVSRFHWWTVEFGLIGSNTRLYGAGLLSSSREAVASDATPKLRLSLDCLDFDYEIAEMQPQLFVVDDWHHLNEQLDLLQAHVS
ncbi:MAG: hypothetical protein F4W90_03015 [Gammaproteobacteria bacterium]|nr:hypothetical protein [Gammaproteobacteria bacterium]